MMIMARGSSLLLIIIIITILHVGGGCFGILTVDAASFVVVVSTAAAKRQPFGGRIQHSSGCCWAKPPPRSSFDLEAIEAFETQLDQQQKEEEIKAMKRNVVNDYGSDNDDDLEEEEENQQAVVVVVIPQHLSGKRIDAALTELLQEQQEQVVLGENISRSFIGNLLTEKCIHLLSSSPSGIRKELMDRKSFKVEEGQEFEISLSSSSKAPTEIIAQDLALDILYEDEYMIVLNKAAHMVVHPAAGNWDGTIVNALAFYLANRSPFGSGEFVNNKQNQDSSSSSLTGGDSLSLHFRPGIVHRLDKGTTGVLVVAKTQSALAKLSADFAARQVKKTYLAITVGNPGKRVVIDKPIGRHPMHRQKMRVVPNHDDNENYKSNRRRNNNNNRAGEDLRVSKPGRRALSMVDTIAFDGKLSLVQVAIQTGRTHQIRVHLQDRHTPIYGDDVYGLVDWNKKLAAQHRIDRPLLHAYRLEIDHPVTGEKMYFQAPLPDDMLNIAKVIYPRSNTETTEEENEEEENEEEDDEVEEKVFPQIYTQRAAGKRETDVLLLE